MKVRGAYDLIFIITENAVHPTVHWGHGQIHHLFFYRVFVLFMTIIINALIVEVAVCLSKVCH